MTTPAALESLLTVVAKRERAQFHTPEDLAKSISIEAAELLEFFHWNSNFDEAKVRDELADVLTYCMLLANLLGVSPDQLVLDKLAITRAEYSVDKAKRIPFTDTAVGVFGESDSRHKNWPSLS